MPENWADKKPDCVFKIGDGKPPFEIDLSTQMDKLLKALEEKYGKKPAKQERKKPTNPRW